LNLIRVSITGPESTGKSAIAEKLAFHYKTSWVPEVARSYLSVLGRPYKFEDIAIIAKQQLALEDKTATLARHFLFCDTDLIVTKLWSEYKYDKCDPWIAEMVKSHHYDLYLLCNIDLPWEEDPLREHPYQRKELFALYHEELKNLNVNFKIISGIGEERLKNAISAVEETFRELSLGSH